jgi:hypothetical protein
VACMITCRLHSLLKKMERFNDNVVCSSDIGHIFADLLRRYLVFLVHAHGFLYL